MIIKNLKGEFKKLFLNSLVKSWFSFCDNSSLKALHAWILYFVITVCGSLKTQQAQC